jgi:hypothetical protein
LPENMGGSRNHAAKVRSGDVIVPRKRGFRYSCEIAAASPTLRSTKRQNLTGSMELVLGHTGNQRGSIL